MDPSTEINFKPKLGMEFDNLEAAWSFWVNYGGKIGFEVRKQYFNKSKDGSISSCRFVCCKGVRKKDKRDFMTTKPRAETRTECKARIRLILVNGKYKVYDFVEEHNHSLHLVETTHMLASQRKIFEVQAREIELAEDSGIRQKVSFDLMSRHAGGRANLGYTRLDAKNYIQARRQRSLMYGEASALLHYFQEQLLKNPSFYHAFQMDVKEQITNVFWTYAKMIIDYEYFSDVVSLDTTHCTNKENRPLVLFCGLNHHRGIVIFGVALLYDETKDSFKWLFETFLAVHRHKRPSIVFTDQDQAMAKALHEVIPEVLHGLCTWHLMQNGLKHLGYLMKEGSHFLRDFKRCMYEYVDETQFKAAWSMLLSEYNINDNTWLQRVYSIKEKWAACFMKKALTLGIRSTQISESLNSNVKSFMNLDLDIIKFFKTFERVVDEKRYNELKCEFEVRQKIPRLKIENSLMLQQLAKIYTPAIFEKFQEELDLVAAAYIKQKNESGPVYEYVVYMVHKEGDYKVLFHPAINSICCSCMKFECIGILCCHVLKVFDYMDVKILPDMYILTRWTRKARSGVVHDVKGKEIMEDTRLDSTERYRQLCPILIKIATEASECPEAFSLMQHVMMELGKKVTELQLMQQSLDKKDSDITSPLCEHATYVKGFKKRITLKARKRIKSCLEKQGQKRRKNPTKHNSQVHQSMVNEGQIQIEHVV